jgi:hypothetical protein
MPGFPPSMWLHFWLIVIVLILYAVYTIHLSPLMFYIICLLILCLTRKAKLIYSTSTQRDAFIKDCNCAQYLCLHFEILCSPWQVVQRMVTEILTVPGVSRVLYDLTAKPPGTTEWEWCCALNLIAFYTKLCVMLVGCECGASVVIHSRTSALLVLCETSQASISYCACGLAVWIICDKLHFFQRESAIGELYYIF